MKCSECHAIVKDCADHARQVLQRSRLDRLDKDILRLHLARIATGFQPTRLSEHWRKTEARNQVKAYWENKKDSIVSGYVKTLNTEGYESRRADKWRDEITDFNMKRPEFVPPITVETIVRRRMDRPTLREGELKRQVQ